MLTTAMATSQVVRLIPSLNADVRRSLGTPFEWLLGGGLAVRAAPEQLEPVIVDAVARLVLDLANDGSPASVVDITTRAAVRADDVVVMDGFAGHVSVVAGRQVESLHGVQVGQDIERPEDRRSTDAEAPLAGVRHKVGRREMPLARGDQVGDRTARVGQPIPGVIECGLDGGWSGHAGMILSLS